MRNIVWINGESKIPHRSIGRYSTIWGKRIEMIKSDKYWENNGTIDRIPEEKEKQRTPVWKHWPPLNPPSLKPYARP